MANEFGFRGPGSGRTCYILIRDSLNRIWNGSAFVAYVSADFADYDVVATEQGTASNYYVASMPAGITAAGVYGIEARQRLGGAVAETDPTVAQDPAYQWGGAAVVPLSDLATSGQVGRFLPMRMTRGVAVPHFKFYLVSSADHVTPFTSGVVSGQILRDDAISFAALQSGAFTEEGNGFYRALALTSGDLLANTASLLFTAVGVSGGQADPCPFALVLQRSSGQTVV